MNPVEESTKKGRYWNIAESLPDYLKAYTDALPPVRSTIPELDEITQGGFRPGIHFIGGNTGAGKSAFCLWMAERMAQQIDPDTGEKQGVTYISLELGMPEVRARLDSRLSYAMDELEAFRWADFEVLGRKQCDLIKRGEYLPDKDPVYCADLELMSRCPNLRIVDAISNGNLSGILNICSEIQEAGAKRGRVVFIDYLQCIDTFPGQDETEALKENVRAINLAAIRARVAVIAIAAVSRAKGNEMRKGKSGNPGADIFRGSSWIEYTGLTAFALVRKDDAERTDSYVELELWPVKNRRGKCDRSLVLAYNGAFGDFYVPEN